MDDIDGGAREMGSSTPWQPLQFVFKPYIPPNESDLTGGTLRATAKKKKSVRIALHISFHLSNALKLLDF